MPQKLKILYIGCLDEWSGSLGRCEAFRRLGHDVTAIDQRVPLRWFKHRNAFAVRFSFKLFEPILRNYLKSRAANEKYDLVWVNHGAEVPPSVLREWQQAGSKVVHYTTDDPFGKRDGKKWNFVLDSAPYVDAHVVVRPPNVAEAINCGFKKVIKVHMSYNPVQNDPPMVADDAEKWGSDVLFIGTWMPGRDDFLYQLIESGIPLTIYGQRWQFAPLWSKLQAHVKGAALWGPSYAKALRHAKISIGLVSHGNRDEYTTRSFEIPYAGSVLCAERTTEHQNLYADMEEAVFWNDAAECAARCNQLLADEPMRQQIALNGRRRVQELKLADDDVLADILSQLVYA